MSKRHSKNKRKLTDPLMGCLNNSQYQNQFFNAKQVNTEVTEEFLTARYQRAKRKGFNEMAKWISFCKVMLHYGLTVNLYEAKKTKSKYLTVSDGKRSYKVRFSDHKPIEQKEKNKDCDFFVGISNFKVTTTDMAISATLRFFAS